MATEFFEKRTLQGSINVACKYEDGTVRYWNTRKEIVIEHIKEIVEEYQADGYILTLRQLHYQLVTKNYIINHDTAYKKLGNILDDCRYSGIIDWEAIEDRGRVPYLPYWAHDHQDALQDTINSFRIDRQNGQDNHIELWTEKDALSGILRRTTEKYHIQLVVNKGYTSSSAIYKAYQRFLRRIRNGQTVTVLYFGDHDPSGLDMIRDIRERLELMFNNGENYELFLYPNKPIDEVFQVVQIGLSMAQIKKYKLPPNPTKLTDSRSNNYIKQFGKICWEVDALKPQILTKIVETNIEKQIDIPLFKRVLETESEELAALKSFLSEGE